MYVIKNSSSNFLCGMWYF